MNTDTHVPGARVHHELFALTGKHVQGGYDAVVRMLRSGAIPAEYVRGRYYVQRSELPAIAAQLGLTGVTAGKVAA